MSNELLHQNVEELIQSGYDLDAIVVNIPRRFGNAYPVGAIHNIMNGYVLPTNGNNGAVFKLPHVIIFSTKPPNILYENDIEVIDIDR